MSGSNGHHPRPTNRPDDQIANAPDNPTDPPNDRANNPTGPSPTDHRVDPPDDPTGPGTTGRHIHPAGEPTGPVSDDPTSTGTTGHRNNPAGEPTGPVSDDPTSTGTTGRRDDLAGGGAGSVSDGSGGAGGLGGQGEAVGGGIGRVLRDAMVRRAAAVDVSPSTEVRTAVDERIAHRARVRRTRRAVGATAMAMAALVLVAGAVLLAGDDGSHVATDDGRRAATTTVTEPRPLVLGQSADDPAELGLPRVGFDPDLALELQPTNEPLVTTAPTGASLYGFEQMQVFRQVGDALPVIVIPGRAAGTNGGPLPTGAGSTTISVNGTDAILQGTPPGWAHLTWTLTDGSHGDLYAYGLATEALVEVAEGLRRSGSGFAADHLPAGFSEERLSAPPADDVVAQYRLVFTRGEVHVQLDVTTATREEQAESLLAGLTTFGVGENRDVLGSPGVLLGADRFWSAASDPRPRVTASVTISGATRAEVEEIVTGLRELPADGWSAALDGGVP